VKSFLDYYRLFQTDSGIVRPSQLITHNYIIASNKLITHGMTNSPLMPRLMLSDLLPSQLYTFNLTFWLQIRVFSL
jgi:hypothetical protein